MNLHEYQAKQLFSEYGIPVPEGAVAASPDEARAAAERLGNPPWVIKAQIHSGGRGKVGGVKLADDPAAAARIAGEMIGKRLVTKQTGGAGLPVDCVWVERGAPAGRELYLSAVVDRASARIVFVASAAGGMDIEAVAAETPERIVRTFVHPASGLQAHQCRSLGFALGLAPVSLVALQGIMQAMHRLIWDLDLSQVEINPLLELEQGGLMALDAKVNGDDNAVDAHPEWLAWHDPRQDDAREAEARKHGLSYVTLDGNIGCMVNGAGLAMATMDVIRLHGGQPANFLDVGGGTTAAKVAEAFKLIMADQQVKAVLINIFGGIVRCSLIAEGVIAAVKEVGVSVPLVVRLEGTQAAEGRALLEQSGLALTTAMDLDEAARLAVEAAR